MRNYRPGEGRRRIQASAIYRDRRGKLWGYDFVVNKSERERIIKLFRKFRNYEKSGTENTENSTELKGGFQPGDFN